MDNNKLDKLLAAVKRLRKDAAVFGLAGASNGASVRCQVEGLTLGHWYDLDAAMVDIVNDPKTDELIRPMVGQSVWLYPPRPWLTDGSGVRGPARWFTIGEWRGNTAVMRDGYEFRWSPSVGFLM